MPRVRALQTFADHREGDEFDLTDDQARTLSTPDLLGGQKVEMIETRAMQANDSPLTEPRRGRYSRRDLRAKE